MYYVNARWLGAMLTNFKTMRGRVERLNQLKKMQEDGTFDMLPKGSHEAPGRDRQAGEVSGRVVEMKKLPGACSWLTPARSAMPSMRPASCTSPS